VVPIMDEQERKSGAFRHFRSNIQSFGKLAGVFSVILLSLSLSWRMEKPTISQLQSYANDGSLNLRVHSALAFGNHIVAPDLVRDFYAQIERIRLIQAGTTDAEIDRDLGVAPIVRNVLQSKGTVNMVNGLLLGNDYIVPDPLGPLVDGKDVLLQAVKDRLEPLGCRVVPLDCFYPYHRWGGEIHCGTIATRRRTLM